MAWKQFATIPQHSSDQHRRNGELETNPVSSSRHPSLWRHLATSWHSRVMTFCLSGPPSHRIIITRFRCTTVCISICFCINWSAFGSLSRLCVMWDKYKARRYIIHDHCCFGQGRCRPILDTARQIQLLVFDCLCTHNSKWKTYMLPLVSISDALNTNAVKKD